MGGDGLGCRQRGLSVRWALVLPVLALVLASIPKADSQASFCRLNGLDKCVGRQHILEEQVSLQAALRISRAVPSHWCHQSSHQHTMLEPS